MRFQPFKLERWLSESRFECDVDLSASVITHLKFNELIQEKDLDAPVRIGPTNGIPALREEISKLYSGVVQADGVLVTHGCAEANFLLLNYLVSQDDECIFLVPNYMQAKGILEGLGAKVRLVSLNKNNFYHPDVSRINELASRKTKAILITNPNNPTGARLTSKELEAICDIAHSVDAFVIGDEVLSGLEIDGTRTFSPVEIYEKGISTRSVSKLGLSGLRIGWIAARNPEIARKCWSLRDYTSLGNSYFNQRVALAALNKFDWIAERNRKILISRRKILMHSIKENADVITCTEPKAGATCLMSYKTSANSVDYCRKLAIEERVAVSPGDYFEAPRTFRILYGTDEEKLKTGLGRICRFTRSTT